jgi:hypothetical protein
MSNSYWVIRNLNGDAIGLLDKEPNLAMEDGDNGDGSTSWVGYIKFVPCGRGYFKFSLGDTMEEVYPITKAQYETYQAFGLFDGR